MRLKVYECSVGTSSRLCILSPSFFLAGRQAASPTLDTWPPVFEVLRAFHIRPHL
jgi:hypothetical protein